MRRLGLSPQDVERLVADFRMLDSDDEGNMRYTSFDGERFLRIIVATNDVDFVITVHERDQWP